MMQQINLYQPMFRKQKKVFSAVTMLQVSLFFVAVFAAIYGYQYYKVMKFRDQLARLDKEIIQQTTQLENMKKQAGSKTRSKLLENEIARVSRQIEARKTVIQVLEKYNFAGSQGFASYLEALARQHVQGTWLTNVMIAGGGNTLGLQGKTLASELVPRYIQQLGNETVLSGKSFNVLELYRGKETPVEHLLFRVSTN